MKVVHVSLRQIIATRPTGELSSSAFFYPKYFLKKKKPGKARGAMSGGDCWEGGDPQAVFGRTMVAWPVTLGSRGDLGLCTCVYAVQCPRVLRPVPRTRVARVLPASGR